MCVHMYVYITIHIYVAYIHTQTHTYICTYIHSYIHTYVLTYIHTYINTYIHAYTHKTQRHYLAFHYLALWTQKMKYHDTHSTICHKLLDHWNQLYWDWMTGSTIVLKPSGCYKRITTKSISKCAVSLPGINPNEYERPPWRQMVLNTACPIPVVQSEYIIFSLQVDRIPSPSSFPIVICRSASSHTNVYFRS